MQIHQHRNHYKMLRRKAIPSFWTAVLLMWHLSFSSLGQVDSLKNAFNNYQEHHLQEKVFVHTDKSVYLAQEVIWFKIYVTDAFFHRPFDLSTVIYAELIDQSNKAVLQAKIPLQAGFGDGSFLIPATIETGRYTLRLYTRWMQNFAPEDYFEKQLTIINTLRPYEGHETEKTQKIDLNFFPEGGHLVQGLSGDVAFRVSKNGIGLTGTGYLLNQQSDTVARFTPTKFGMGNFVLTPTSTQRIRAFFTTIKGDTISQNLPKIQPSGHVINLKQANSDTLLLTVRSSVGEPIYLLVHTRGVLKTVRYAKNSSTTKTFHIPTVDLGDGISLFTIFNQNREPIAERLFFKYPEQTFDIRTTISEKTPDVRSEVEISIKTTDREGQLLPANLSMAIYRVDSLQGFDKLSISNYLWLTSDLRGVVESPEYYFSKEGKVDLITVDNLMLTHGWRRFNWDSVLNNKALNINYLPEISGHLIEGKLTKVGSNEVESGIHGFLSVIGKRSQFYTATSNVNDLLTFDVTNFYNSGEVVLQTQGKYEKDHYTVEILNPFSTKFTDKKIQPFSLTNSQQNALQSRHLGVQVQQAYHQENTLKFIAQPLDSNAFYRVPEFTYNLDEYMRFPTIEDVLREYVTTVAARKKNGQFQLRVNSTASGNMMSESPLVLFDGLRVRDMGTFLAYNPQRIEKLELISKRYQYGGISFDGILNFTSKEGNLPNYKLDPKTTIIDYEGLQKRREFHADAQRLSSNSRLPDFRSTILWKPTLLTNGEASASGSVNFFTSDIPGNYVVVIQGITASGKTGNFATQLIVK